MIYLYSQDQFESKYQLLIIKREKVGLKELKNSKAFIDYSQTIDCKESNKEKKVKESVNNV